MIRKLVEDWRLAREKKEEIEKRLEEVENKIFELFKDRIDEFGSKTINEQGYKIVITVPKNVSWDQTKLKEIAKNIKTHGDNPENYISYKISIPETTYKSFPEQIKKVFESARTIKPGKKKLEIK